MIWDIRIFLLTTGINCSHASKALSDESGYNTESKDVSEFRTAVLAGEWSKAESHLSNIPLLENASLEEALFLIREQKFLEALEDKEYTSALSILRTELSPLNINTEKVHNLSRYEHLYS
jgi:WD repeat-containing protein 26